MERKNTAIFRLVRNEIKSNKTNMIANDIDAYLKTHQNKSLLRFITCGSVDDGKSTLIGRLLYDSKMIFDDQLAQLKIDSKSQEHKEKLILLFL